jgi:hypothetical protein
MYPDVDNPFLRNVHHPMWISQLHCVTCAQCMGKVNIGADVGLHLKLVNDVSAYITLAHFLSFDLPKGHTQLLEVGHDVAVATKHDATSLPPFATQTESAHLVILVHAQFVTPRRSPAEFAILNFQVLQIYAWVSLRCTFHPTFFPLAFSFRTTFCSVAVA